MSIEDGEFTALVGPSGSGKTTLLQLMGCLDRPDSGAIWIDGRDVTRLNANQRADQLSGGAQQRVAIARALAPRPSLILADEPTANLDTANGEQAIEIMKQLNEQTGTAFVFATHDSRVMAYARRVVKLRDGQIVDDGAGS